MTKTVTTLVPHPLSETFPLMEGEDFKKLKYDIMDNGLREPIVLYEGKILDGRNRYNACIKRGLPLGTKDYTGADPLGFVISMNIHWRHLTAEKKREITEKLLRANPQLSDRAIAAQAKGKPHHCWGSKKDNCPDRTVTHRP